MGFVFKWFLTYPIGIIILLVTAGRMWEVIAITIMVIGLVGVIVELLFIHPLTYAAGFSGLTNHPKWKALYRFHRYDVRTFGSVREAKTAADDLRKNGYEVIGGIHSEEAVVCYRLVKASTGGKQS